MGISRTGKSGMPHGATVYSKSSLKVYDLIVHGFSNPMIWRCSSRHLIDHIQQYLSPNHLEIGPGSGRQLKKSIRPSFNFSRLVIADVNADCLQVAAETLQSWSPNSCVIDLLQPESISNAMNTAGLFDSIGINYVLHCLPMGLEQKLDLCESLVDQLLNPGGVLFGSTLVPTSRDGWLTRRVLKFYNSRRVFSNEGDSMEGIESGLQNRKCSFELNQRGSVCFFAIQKTHT